MNNSSTSNSSSNQGRKPPYANKKPHFNKDKTERSPQRQNTGRQFKKQIPEAVAVIVLHQTLDLDTPFDESWISAASNIRREEVATIRPLCYGTMRWHGILKEKVLELIGSQSGTLHPKIHLLLEIGVWQLSHSNNKKDIVYNCVEACIQLGLSGAKNFVNAILKKAEKHLEEGTGKLTNSSEIFPEWLQMVLREECYCQDDIILFKSLGESAAKMRERSKEISLSITEKLMDLHTQQPITTLRILEHRISADKYSEQLNSINITHERGCFHNSITIRQNITIEKLPGASVGAILEQDLSAQCAAHILQPKPGMRVLSACAAPGRETSHLQEVAQNQLELTALELDPYRSRKLRENMGKLRCDGKVLIGSAAFPTEWWGGRQFQAILLQSPSSGTGVMRRHTYIPWFRKEKDIIKYSAQGYKMLKKLWLTLEENGRLLFMSASVLPEENDFVIARFIQEYRHVEVLDFQIPLNSILTVYGKQIIPSETNDSYYYCLLQKSKSSQTDAAMRDSTLS